MSANSLFATHYRDEKSYLYIGRSDSNVVYRIGNTDNRTDTADWRSSWFDGGDRSTLKRVNSYNLTYSATSGDSIFVDFYTNLSETAVATVRLGHRQRHRHGSGACQPFGDW